MDTTLKIGYFISLITLSIVIPAWAECNYALGVSTGTVQQFQISGSPPRQIDLLANHTISGLSVALAGDLGDYAEEFGVIPESILEYSVDDVAPAKPDAWTSYHAPVIVTSGVSDMIQLVPAIVARHVRLTLPELQGGMTIAGVELYGCTEGVDAGVEAGNVDILSVTADLRGCSISTVLLRPYQVTGISLYTNATSAPAHNQVQVYYRNKTQRFVQIHLPQTPIMSSDGNSILVKLGFSVSATEMRVECDVVNWGMCKGIGVHGVRLSGCPPSFVEHDGRCSRMSHIERSFEDVSHYDVCQEMMWQHESTLLSMRSLTDLVFSYNYLANSGNIVLGMIYEEGVSSWQDGLNITEEIDNMWAPNHPMAGTNCVTLDRDGLKTRTCTAEETYHYVCKTTPIGNENDAYAYSNCEWFMTSGKHIVSSDEDSVWAATLSDCMYLCQLSSCASLSFDSQDEECLLSDMHTADTDNSTVALPNWVTLDWYCFEDEGAICGDDYRHCSSWASAEDCAQESLGLAIYCRHSCGVPCHHTDCNRPLIFANKMNPSVHVDVAASTDISSINMFDIGGTWTPDPGNTPYFFKVEFRELVKVNKMLLAGDLQGATCGVGTFNMFMSNYNDYIAYVNADLTDTDFYGFNITDKGRMMVFDPPMIAMKYVIVPLTPSDGSNTVCLQFEMYGCVLQSDQAPTAVKGDYYALGIEDGRIQDFQISSDDFRCDAHDCNPPWSMRGAGDTWSIDSPGGVSSSHWLQVDLLTSHLVTYANLRPHGNDIVTAFQVLASTTDIGSFAAVTDGNDIVLEFGGMRMQQIDTFVHIGEVRARYIRIVPTSHTGAAIHLALELYGKPLLNECNPIDMDMAEIEEPAPSDDCVCRPSPTFNQFKLCLTSTPIELIMKLKNMHFLHGLKILSEDESADVTVSISYLNDYTASAPYSYSDLDYTLEINTSAPRATALTARLMTQVTHLKVQVSSVATHCALLQVHACSASECPPKFVQYEEKCYRLPPKQEIMLSGGVSFPDLDQLAECRRSSWAGRRASLVQIPNQYHHHFLTSLFKCENDTDGYYTGAICIEYDGWGWIDGSLTTWMGWTPDYPGVTDAQACAVLTADGLVDTDCETPRRFLCSIDVTKTESYDERRWIAHNYKTPDERAATAHVKHLLSITECLQTCADFLVEPDCVAALYNEGTRNCSLYSQTSTTLRRATIEHYFELITETRIEMNNATLLFEATDDGAWIPFIPFYSTNASVTVTIRNIDSKDIPESYSDGNFKMTLSFLNDGLIVKSLPLNISEWTAGQGLPSGHSLTLHSWIEETVEEASCSDISSISVAVLGEEGGYLIVNEQRETHIINLPVTPDLVNCSGLAITDLDLILPLIGPRAVLVNNTVTFVYSWRMASNMNCTLVLKLNDSGLTGQGDQGVLIEEWRQRPEYRDHIHGNHSVNYTFTTNGHVSVSARCVNMIGSAQASTELAVELDLEHALTITVDYIPAAVPLDVAFMIEKHANYLDMAAIHAHCSFDYTSDGNDVHNLTLSIGSDGHRMSKQYTVDNAQGYFNATIICQNNLSSKRVVLTVFIREEISDGAIEAAEAAFETATPATFYISLYTGSHVQAMIDYGDATGITMEQADIGNSVAPRQWNVQHVYNSPGNYTITVHRLYNAIFSNDTVTSTTVVIQNALTDLHLTPNATSILSPPGAILFTLTEGETQAQSNSDVHCVWGTIPGMQNWFTFIQHFPYVLGTDTIVAPFVVDVDTHVTISATCSNLITPEYNVSASVTVLVDDINIISFLPSDPDWWGNASMVTLTLEPLHSYVNYDFAMGNNDTCSLTNPGETSINPHCSFVMNPVDAGVELSLSYVYSVWGNYTVTVTARNQFPQYDVTRSVDISVFEWTCNQPLIELPPSVRGGLVHTIQKSAVERIDVFIITDCMKSSQVSYEWSILDQNGTTMPGVREGLVTNTSALEIPSRYLDYGNYTLRVAITMVIDDERFGSHNTPVQTRADARIEITRSPIVVILDGVDELLEVHHNNILILNGSGSYDKNIEPPYTADGITFEWFCKQASTAVTVELDNPAAALVTSMCPDGLFSTEPVLYGPIVQFDIQAAVAIGQSSLKAGYEYIFKLRATKPGHPPSPTPERRVRVLKSEGPVLNIHCESGCNEGEGHMAVGNSGRKVFDFSCRDNCFTVFGNLSQMWSLHLLDEGGSMEDPAHDLALNEGYFMSTSLSNARVTLEPNALQGGRMYSLGLSASTPGSLQAHSNLSLLVTHPPHGGHCAAGRFQGVVMQDVFLVACEGWQSWLTASDSTLSYDFYAATDGSNERQLLQSGVSRVFSSSHLPVGQVHIDVDIRDAVGVTTYDSHITLSVQSPESESNDDVLERLIVYLDELDPSNVQQTSLEITSMLSILDTRSAMTLNSTHEDSTDDSLEPIINFDTASTAVREKIADVVLQMDVSEENLEPILTLSTNLLSNRGQVSADLMNKTSTIISKIAHSLVEEMSEINIDRRVFLTQKLLITFSTLMKNGESFVIEGSVMENTATAVAAWKETEAAVNAVASSLSSIMYENETETIITPELKMHIRKSKALNGTTSSIGDARLALSAESNPDKICQTLIALVSYINPHAHGTDASQVNSEVISISLGDCNIQEQFQRTRRSVNPGNAIEATLPVHNVEAVEVLYDFAESTIIHQFLNVTSPEQHVFITVFPTRGLIMDAYINYNVQPSTDDYVIKYQIPRILEEVHDDVTTEHRFELERTLYIPPENLTASNVTTIHLGLQIQGCENAHVNCTAPGEILYSYIMAETQCRRWHEQDERWISDGCQIQPYSTVSRVQVKSNLLGSIGAGVFVAPNTVNFDTVFDNIDTKLLDSAAVLATVVSVLILFAPLCVICHYWDKKDQIKWGVLPLIDNDAADEHAYELHLYTGLRSDAGTDSRISVIIAGTESDSGVRKLTDGVRSQHFKQGSVSSFLMTTPDSLGVPVTLKVWHDNSGSGRRAGWYLLKAVLVDVKQHKWYLFVCDAWLAADEGDGSLTRTLHLASSDESVNSLLQNNLKRKLYEDHIWLSIGYRKTKSTFTRVQRLCCCLSLLFLTMITNAMWFKDDKEDEKNDSEQSGITIGQMDITVRQLYVSFITSIIIIPPILLMTYFFAKSDPFKPTKENKYTIYETEGIPRGLRIRWFRRVPHWFVYIGFILVIVSVVTSGFFTILFAFEWGKAKSEKWLIALLMTFVESFVFIQPLKVFMVTMFISFLIKKDSDLSRFEQSFGKRVARDESTTLTSIEMPSSEGNMTKEECELAKRRGELDRRFKDMVREVICHVIMVVIMSFVIVGNQNHDVFYQNQNIRNIFTNEMPEGGTKADLVVWINETVLPSLYNTHKYNSDIQSEYMKKFIVDSYAMRLGPPRLRSLRVLQENCRIKHPLLGQVKQCRYTYSFENEDTADYYPDWTSNASHTTPAPGALVDAFIYRFEDELGGTPYWAIRNRYSGGGYVANLGNQKSEALQLFHDLIEHNWIDHFSRAMMVEFNIYNANTNLFNYVLICVEFPSEGALLHSVDINSVVLYRYVGAGGLIALISELLLGIIFTLLSIREVVQIVKHKMRYFRQFWNIVKIMSMVLFYTAVGVYAWRSVLTAATVEKVLNNRETSINFQALATANSAYLQLMGLCCFLVQLSLLHILRYNQTIAVLSETLRASASELVNIVIGMLVVIGAFASFSTVYFGSYVYDYRSLQHTLAALVSGSMGYFKYKAVEESTGVMGAMMLLLYLVLMMYFMFNFFVSILNKFLAEIQNDPALHPKYHEVIDHMMSVMKFHIGLDDRKKSAEQQQIQKKKVKEERRKLNKRYQSTLDTDHLLTRVSRIESIAETMEPSLVATALSNLLDGFLTYRANNPRTDVMEATASDPQSPQPGPSRSDHAADWEIEEHCDSDDALTLVVQTAMLQMARDIYERMLADARRSGAREANNSLFSVL